MAADTDRASYWRFVDQARRFRQGLIGYLENQGAFDSRRWFTTLDGKVETASLPHFAESPEGPGELLERLAWRIAALVGLNGLLYLAASLAFARRQIA
jgi:hypothetical protein